MHSQTRQTQGRSLRFGTLTHTVQNDNNDHLLGFKQADLVSGPLNGVLYDRGERLESAEWDLLFWGVPLVSKERIYLGAV